ncbi:M50 family metallopeptidase [Catenuloplanes sp. NPDC051500]|uniref:M50 family metallopeptidase n=1 Tax=Catenuloplanes sp. NPDC051500 TaxID=3363959 RepID=UPI0037ADEBDD
MTSAEPSLLLAVGSLILGLAASVLWTLTRYLITAAHEGSHALFGSVSGGRVDSVRLHPDSSGLTVTISGSLFLTAVSGYLGPSLFGLAGATMLAHGIRPDAVLWTCLVLLIVVFIQLKNVFGLFIVGLYGTFFFLLVRYGSPGLRALGAYTLIWFLLLGGVIHTAMGDLKNGDSVNLRKATMIPVGFWGGFWWLSTMAALIYGGGILLGLIAPPLG